MNNQYLFLTPKGKLVIIGKKDTAWSNKLSTLQKLSLKPDDEALLNLEGEEQQCILLKQGLRSELEEAEAALLKSTDLSQDQPSTSKPSNSAQVMNAAQTDDSDLSRISVPSETDSEVKPKKMKRTTVVKVNLQLR